MTVEEAVDILASHAVAAAVEDRCEDGWENYPDVGEYDWEEVCATMRTRHPFPGRAEYAKALEVLTSRAALSGGEGAMSRT